MILQSKTGKHGDMKFRAVNIDIQTNKTYEFVVKRMEHQITYIYGNNIDCIDDNDNEYLLKLNDEMIYIKRLKMITIRINVS